MYHDKGECGRKKFCTSLDCSVLVAMCKYGQVLKVFELNSLKLLTFKMYTQRERDYQHDQLLYLHTGKSVLKLAVAQTADWEPWAGKLRVLQNSVGNLKINSVYN